MECSLCLEYVSDVQKVPMIVLTLEDESGTLTAIPSLSLNFHSELQFEGLKGTVMNMCVSYHLVNIRG